MITFLVARGHRRSHLRIADDPQAPALAVTPYDRLKPGTTVDRGTFIFTDFDQLGHQQLAGAAALFRQMRDAGWAPLNDPARVRQRYALLHHLRGAGINRFGIYRVETGEMPSRYPVFIRNESGHEGPLTGLLGEPAAIPAEIERLAAAGYAERGLVIVEYAAAPVAPGLFRRLAAFRVGHRTFMTTSVHDPVWVAKVGYAVITDDALLAEENHAIRNNPWRSVLDRAFDIARIDYGRADFAVVEGVVQIYEINTNPSVRPPRPHASPVREDTRRRAWANYLGALAALDARPADGPDAIVVDRHRRNDGQPRGSRARRARRATGGANAGDPAAD